MRCIIWKTQKLTNTHRQVYGFSPIAIERYFYDIEIGQVIFPPEIMTKLCSQGHPGFYTKPKEDYTEFELELANYEKNIDYI